MSAVPHLLVGDVGTPESSFRSVFKDNSASVSKLFTQLAAVVNGSVAYGEEGPTTGHPLQFVLAALTEVDAGPHDEVLDHSRYEDLAWCGDRADAGRDVDRQSA